MGVPVCEEEKMRTRIDGRNKKEKKKQRQMERESARGEYEFIELTLQSLVLFCRERQFEKIKQSQDVL